VERCIVSHEVAPAKKENMSSFAGESLKCADIAIFPLHFGDHRIILKRGLDAKIVADGTAMGPAHSYALGGGSPNSIRLPGTYLQAKPALDAALQRNICTPMEQKCSSWTHPEEMSNGYVAGR
jgi:hypothetical protein